MTAQQPKASRPQNSRSPASGQAPVLDLRVGVETDAGPVRELNEDYVAYFQPADRAQLGRKGAIFLVADGMGGHQAGEVASQMAAECVMREYYADAERQPGDSLVRAVKFANQLLYNEAQADASRQGMGTTLVAAVVLGQQVYVVNVGDSRAYLISSQGITQITQDHSWVEEQVQAGLLTREQAEQHPQRNLITRALGHNPSVQVDLFKGEIRSGDTLLLCSDGLCGPLSDRQLAAIAFSRPPSKAAGKLVAQAKIQHAEDNISVLIVQATDPASPPANALELAEEDVIPTELSSQPPADLLASISAGLQNLIEKIPLDAEKRQWLLVGLATFIFFCCLGGGLAGFWAIGQKFSEDPVAAPQMAPIGPVDLTQDDPSGWAGYLGYPDAGAMGDRPSATAADLWPARRCVFMVGAVRDWNCQGKECTFDLEMAGQEYVVRSEQRFFTTDGIISKGDQVRVFGCQEGEGPAFAAHLIDRQGPWWAWQTVYQNHDWSEPVWVYGIADCNSNSPLKLGDYPGLTRGDRILLHGQWRERDVEEAMSFEPQDVYRLDGGRYVLIEGAFAPAPRPTATLVPTGR